MARNTDTRKDWLAQVAAHTEPGRLARAERHEQTAAQAALAGEESRRRWHDGRARAERERLQRVLGCRTTAITPTCPCCGGQRAEQDVRCESWRYCVHCRGVRCADYRKRMDAGISAARAIWARERNLQGSARWAERLLTLTVPHSGDAARDFATLQAAWRSFARAYRAWMRKRKRLTREQSSGLPYARVLEITGSDDGHAHAHVWLLGPFVSHVALRVLWGRALARADAGAHYVPVRSVDEISAEIAASGGSRFAIDATLAELRELRAFRRRPRAFVPWPVLDVRAANREVGSELVKYLTKDCVRDGEEGELCLRDPAEYARLIEATEQRRLVCTSRYFAPARDPLYCPDCARPYVAVRRGELVTPSEALSAAARAAVLAARLPLGPPPLSCIP